MRLIALLALSLLTLAAAPMHTAEATTTRQQQASSRPAATAPATQARRPAAQRSTTARNRTTTARSHSTTGRNHTAAATPSRNGTNAACQRRDSRGRCVGPRTASWQGGLPTASNTQSDCPAGTMATLARGHSDVTRCMPL